VPQSKSEKGIFLNPAMILLHCSMNLPIPLRHLLRKQSLGASPDGSTISAPQAAQRHATPASSEAPRRQRHIRVKPEPRFTHQR
jgi:hypothetical protein